MTQQQLEHEIARRTGERLRTVRRLGFGSHRLNLGRKLRLQSRRQRRLEETTTSPR